MTCFVVIAQVAQHEAESLLRFAGLQGTQYTVICLPNELLVGNGRFEAVQGQQAAVETA